MKYISAGGIAGSSLDRSPEDKKLMIEMIAEKYTAWPYAVIMKHYMEASGDEVLMVYRSTNRDGFGILLETLGESPRLKRRRVEWDIREKRAQKEYEALRKDWQERVTEITENPGLFGDEIPQEPTPPSDEEFDPWEDWEKRKRELSA